MKKAEAGSGALGRSGSWPASSAVGAAGGLSQQLGSAASTHCTARREAVVRRSSRDGGQFHWEGGEAARTGHGSQQPLNSEHCRVLAVDVTPQTASARNTGRQTLSDP